MDPKGNNGNWVHITAEIIIYHCTVLVDPLRESSFTQSDISCCNCILKPSLHLYFVESVVSSSHCPHWRIGGGGEWLGVAYLLVQFLFNFIQFSARIFHPKFSGWRHFPPRPIWKILEPTGPNAIKAVGRPFKIQCSDQVRGYPQKTNTILISKMLHVLN